MNQYTYKEKADMKYLVILGDGMADYKIESLGNKTPLEAANKPNMDFIAKNGFNGVAKTVPDDMVPESDTANLAILGYDPKIYSKGRSPLEAASMGLEMTPSQYAFRCNVVTLSEGDDYDNRVMLDHSAGEITTEEAAELIKSIEKELGNDVRHFYPGVSYRHCLIYDNPPGYDKDERIYNFSRPHDIIGKTIKDYLPQGEIGEKYKELFVASTKILDRHPINEKRRKEGKNVANSIWLWSPGKKPQLSDFAEKFGIKGTVISAVDLIKGIGLCAGMRSIDVVGATGNYKTNYKGKADAAISAFREGDDFVYVHLEGPDECGHTADIENKVKSIEDIDAKVLGPVMEYLKSTGEDFKVLVMPDHPTPCAIRTHSHENVPFAIYDSSNPLSQGIESFTEDNALKSGFCIEDGHNLLEKLFINK